MSRLARCCRRGVVALLALGVLVWLGPSADADEVTISVAIEDQPVTSSARVRLPPDESTLVEIEIRNAGGAEALVRTIRLRGEVMGLTFFSYETSVGFSVPAGSTQTRRFAVDLSSLRGQATGLIPSSVALLDGRKAVVASQSFVADVRGSAHSTYGMFGLVVAVFTAASFAAAALALARGRLPANRMRRALRFLVPGIGLGLTLVVTTSALRILVPRPSRWIPTVVICSVVLFAVGYLTPAPETGEAEPAESV